MDKNTDMSGVQESLPGFGHKEYSLEKALECDNRCPAGGLIVEIKLVSVTIAANDANNTEILVQAPKNVHRSLREHFYPLRKNAELKSLCFHVRFQNNVHRVITLFSDQMIADKDYYTQAFKHFLAMSGVSYD